MIVDNGIQHLLLTNNISLCVYTKRVSSSDFCTALKIIKYANTGLCVMRNDECDDTYATVVRVK